MAFNFSGIGKTTGVAKVQRRLKPWNIYAVELEDARVDEVQGSKDKTVTYKILKVRFKNDEGYYEESIFFPKDGDEKRPTRTIKTKDGKESEMEMASSLERTEAFLAQVAAVLNPAAFEKMQAYATAGKFKDFETVAAYFIEKVCKPVFGTKTNLKLIGRKDKDGNVQPSLPYFVRISRKGEAELCDNFIGDVKNLYFSPYEETQRKAYLEAKPTDMKKKGDPALDLDGVAPKSDPALEAITEPADSAIDENTEDELNGMLDEFE